MTGFVTNKKALLKALALPSQVSKKNNIKSMKGVCSFIISNGYVSVTGTNINCTVKTQILGAVTFGNYRAAFDSLMFQRYIKTLGNGSIEVVFDTPSSMSVRCGSTRVSFDTVFVEDFTEPSGKALAEVILEPSHLEAIKNKLLHSMPEYDVRYYLNGMYFHSVENVLTLVTTDGHRLSKYNTELPNASVIQKIIHHDVVKLLCKVTQNRTTFEFYETKIVIHNGETTIISTPIEGKYPDYKRVIKNDFPNNIMVDCEVLQNGLNQLKVFHDKKQNGVKVELIKDDKLKLSYEEKEVFLVCKSASKNKENWFGVNIEYLLDAVSSLSDKNITIGFTNSQSIIGLKQHDANFDVFVMPVRL